MKRIACLALAGLFAFGVGAAPVCAEGPVKKDWTFIVWLNGDNNLDPFGVKDVNEMEQIGSTDKVNIVVIMDREKGPANKYLIKKDNKPSQITSPVLQALGELDMGSSKEMVKHVLQIAKEYPANHYVLDIWNHGSGWNRMSNKAPLLRGISYDDTNDSHITTVQLGTACAEIAAGLGQKLDILAMDACLMQMAEVCYEVKDSVAFSCASEETEPGDGYWYERTLAPLATKPSMGAGEYSGVMAAAYKAGYVAIDQDATQSSVDLAQFDKFVKCFDEFCNLLADKMSDASAAAAMKTAVRDSVQSFYYSSNIDLGHFLSLVSTSIKDKAISEAASKVLACYGGGQSPLVSLNGVHGESMKNATGLAIYFPGYSLEAAYSNIKWSKTAWPKFLKAYYAATAAKPKK